MKDDDVEVVRVVGPHLQEYHRLLLTKEFARARELGQTSVEIGILIGQKRTLARLLERRFGPLNESGRSRLEACSAAQLDEITERCLDDAPLSLVDLGLAPIAEQDEGTTP